MSQISQRQFLFLEDLMHSEQLDVVKFQDFAEHCSDPQLKELCNRISNQHRQHYSRLFNLLNQAQGGGTQNSFQQSSTAQWSGTTSDHFPQ